MFEQRGNHIPNNYEVQGLRGGKYIKVLLDGQDMV